MGLQSALEMFHFFRTNTDRCWLWTPPSTKHQTPAFLTCEGQPMAVKLLCVVFPKHLRWKISLFSLMSPRLQRKKKKELQSLPCRDGGVISFLSFFITGAQSVAFTARNLPDFYLSLPVW